MPRGARRGGVRREHRSAREGGRDGTAAALKSTMTRRVRSVPLGTFVAGAGAETVLFRSAPSGPPDPDHRALARACVDEASERLGAGTNVLRFSASRSCRFLATSWRSRLDRRRRRAHGHDGHGFLVTVTFPKLAEKYNP
ncbi:hypothetical protein PVAP13_1KG243700 [Panicum virgatum]|uniref:Uncharacterized protein n=1 Tax=Panicum virgatum TaxID=38727 RepID=A0A8T0XLX2_PANVG|nr:hypothetical protein PVAP13_1KG243700 [Panicum virgatum]